MKATLEAIASLFLILILVTFGAALLGIGLTVCFDVWQALGDDLGKMEERRRLGKWEGEQEERRSFEY